MLMVSIKISQLTVKKEKIIKIEEQVVVVFS